jgi:hypothetical protein
VQNLFEAQHVIKTLFCEACYAGLSPWFAPVCRCGGGGGGGLHFALVCRALCIFAPLSTPNKLLLLRGGRRYAVSQDRVAAWPLA